MKVHRPSQNKITQGFKPEHRAFDFSGRGDLNCYTCLDCECIERVDEYDHNWRANQPSDPFRNDPRRPKLILEDYGNYAKFRHYDGSFSLYAHLQRGSVPQVGQKFKQGEACGTIGNTGNSTARHLHFEFRARNGVNIKVEFEDDMSDELNKCLDEKDELSQELELEQQRTIDCRDDRTAILGALGLPPNTGKERAVERVQKLLFNINQLENQKTKLAKEKDVCLETVGNLTEDTRAFFNDVGVLVGEDVNNHQRVLSLIQALKDSALNQYSGGELIVLGLKKLVNQS